MARSQCIRNDKKTETKNRSVTRRAIQALLVATMASGMMGCEELKGVPKAVNEYFNLRNSFLDPSQVGRFDYEHPFGDVKPVKWPILEQLDVIDEPVDRWTTATDPTPADLVADKHEEVIGPGDILRISVWELVQPNAEYARDQAQVSETGGVSIQNLGTVQVAGLTPSQIEEKIGQLAVERNLLLPKGNGSQGPQVTVTLLQSRSRIFSILGQISAPGTYNIQGNDFRLLDALALARDIAGGTGPGMDYVYVIRHNTEKPEEGSQAPGNVPSETTPTPPAGTGNPLDALDQLDKSTTAPANQSTPGSAPAESTPVPAPTTPESAPAAPASGPSSIGPRFVRPIATATVVSDGSAPMLAQADMDAALTPAPAAATSQPAATTAAAGTLPATTMPGSATSQPDELLNQAMGTATTKNAPYVFIDGKWVAMPTTAPASGAAETAGTQTPAPTGTGVASAPPAEAMPSAPTSAPAGPATTESFASAEQLMNQRVIRVPLNPLREGNPKYNIVIRPGDTIVIPTVEQGFFYMMGHVNRPGVFALSGQKITLKMAVAAAGNLDALAIPRRCDLIRRIGNNQEVTVQVNLQAIFNGSQPDIFLKANDVVNVGTDAIAPFLAVTRNGYRAAYGWGFTYDRNYYITPTIVQ
ncbi:MAG TPA: polysaccharide biosynthesis/export family protein [Phycisphaerae bacterium]|nr:polysaccharide biosynthesis/export family protein [Phycisphaerae bacterium]